MSFTRRVRHADHCFRGPRGGPYPIIALLLVTTTMAADNSVRTVTDLPRDKPNSFYIGNKEPLARTPFVKLPIGSIQPQGWLRKQLELEADGMTGHLQEISQWCEWDGNAWVTPPTPGAKLHSGWEEMPYWLKGYGDLGYVLRNDRITNDARKWIEAILANQEPDGWFAPRELRTSLEGKPDLWPAMIVLNCLQSYYESTGDMRVLGFMTNYFKWELNCPDKDFLAGFWPRMRAGDNLETIYWLYNRTGEAWLLDLAKKVHDHTADWTTAIPTTHGVNIAQGFREPAIYSMQAHDGKFLQATERNYDTIMSDYGQFPGGMFAADENFRPGHSDPRQAAETCTMVEFMHSFEMLTRITGNAQWADRCEDVAFNSFPAATTSDFKALHYLTAPNLISCDRGDKSPGVQNAGTQFSYSPGAVYRCCQHNVSHGWPYYAEELFLATNDNGLCASLYAPCDVRATVGDSDGGGTQIRIQEQTDYPFGETVRLNFSTPGPVRFPLYLRIPRWCDGATVRVNGDQLNVTPLPPLPPKPLDYVVIDRTWNGSDQVIIEFPMQVKVRAWEKNANSVSIDRGPLTYSLAIGEKWTRCGSTDQWPDMELAATTPWNYALMLDDSDPASSIKLAHHKNRRADEPFNPDASPIELRVRAKKIPAWKADSKGLVAPLHSSPIRSTEPVELVTLIPMGAARLRITSFPVIGKGKEAHDWPTTLPAAASHVWQGDTLDALSDGLSPANSHDESIPRFTWWDHKGSEEWTAYSFPTSRKISSSAVYWFDDQPNSGSCRVPASWSLAYKDGNEWKPITPITGKYSLAIDRFNRVKFEEIETTQLRLSVKLRPGFSAGILEWRVD